MVQISWLAGVAYNRINADFGVDRSYRLGLSLLRMLCLTALALLVLVLYLGVLLGLELHRLAEISTLLHRLDIGR